ncbi:hypothetical protein [Flavobacterium luteum]|uniref:Uncharacterized protein n=1 Tax=Flavobacterium luteum TaxID=2026654 RepID=A0A7J5AC79_9FLAO|nr:hypothetical protein [Flavobacterium luteum]KAB1155048.1 hypothetical protein F6464_11545 [Flavobacterium luteum]
MRVVGYINEKKENTFANPVYSNRSGEYFLHVLDLAYNIINFVKTDIKEDTFKKIYLSKKFEINAKGALVFIGKEYYIKYDSSENAIEEVIHYINDVLPVNESKPLVTEANTLKKSILSDKFIVNNFEVNINPQKEQFILTFDFPSPTKDTKSEIPSKNGANVLSKQVKQDQTTDAAYASILEYLTRVNLNVELTLKLRANERRSKLKTLNYQFKLSKNSSKKSNS